MTLRIATGAMQTRATGGYYRVETVSDELPVGLGHDRTDEPGGGCEGLLGLSRWQMHILVWERRVRHIGRPSREHRQESKGRLRESGGGRWTACLRKLGREGQDGAWGTIDSRQYFCDV